MTIPLDNLYDYIFSLTGHNNKNLAMYCFFPYGTKSFKNMVCWNNFDDTYLTLKSGKKAKSSHPKLLFANDQEPLNFKYYNDFFEKNDILSQHSNLANIDSIQKKLLQRKNIGGGYYCRDTIYDKRLLLHSEKNSKDLKKYEKNGFLGIYYWCHAFMALDWYRFAKHDIQLDYSCNGYFDKDFNIYCRAWSETREYRLKFLELLVKNNNAIKKTNVFFNAYDNDNIHYSNYSQKNDIFSLSSDKNIFEKNTNIFMHNKSMPTMSATYTPKDYQNSAIDIVLETVFNENKIHLTEKILRPIACGKPFILLSGVGSLAYLRSYGFKTFDEFINEDYDLISCPIKRLESVIETMESISSQPQHEKQKIFQKMHKIAEENKKWFFSEIFFNIINDELKENLHRSFTILDNPKYQTGKELRIAYRFYRRYVNFLDEEHKKEALRHIQGYPERIELSKKNIGKY